jgi:hypothetical protein
VHVYSLWAASPRVSKRQKTLKTNKHSHRHIDTETDTERERRERELERAWHIEQILNLNCMVAYIILCIKWVSLLGTE